MIITLLQDITENTIDAVIISYETTSQELQDIFYNVKENNPEGYEWDDFVNALPTDCTIYDVNNDLKNNIIGY